MKTQNVTLTQTINIAALSAAITDMSPDGWYQLLPAGHFSARDGRPFDVKGGKWFIDAAIAKRFIEETAAIGQPVLIDYNHETLQDPNDPKPKPPQKDIEAAGWITDPLTQMQWRDGAGLFVKPVWTDDALARINAKKFGFLSAVFPYDILTGYPLYLRMSALTNDPGVTGMKSLVALSATQLHDFLNPTRTEQNPMNDLLKSILIALGVISADDTTEYTAEQLQELANSAGEAINALKTASQAAAEMKTAVDDASTQADAGAEVTAIASENAEEIKEAQALMAEAKLHNIDLSVAVPRSYHNKVVQRMATLSAEDAHLTAEQLIAKARKQGRIVKAEVPLMIALSQTQGLAALSAEINSRKPVVALSAIQTRQVNTPPKNEQNTVALSAEDKIVAEMRGMTEAEYQAHKAKVVK